jgi:Flp pilus assembly pilin Flp
MKKIFKRKQFCANDEGMAAIEFGMVFPFMVIVFFGLIDLTSLISSSRKITNASAVVADLVGQNGAPFSTALLEDYKMAVRMILPDKPDTEIRMNIEAYWLDGTTVKRKWHYFSPTGPECAKVIDTTKMPDLMKGPNELVVAQVCMIHRPLFQAFNNSPILGNVNIKVQEVTITRPRARNIVECTNCDIN